MLLLGHRGARASRHSPENTIASFELCFQHGCDGFEFDVRRSADGHAVICHDPATRGMKIAETSAKDLGLPTLEEVLERFSARAFLDIELKVRGLEEQTLAALQSSPPRKGYVVSSFLPEVLRAIHVLDADVALGLLAEKRNQLKLRRRASSPVRNDPAADAALALMDSVSWLIPRLNLASPALIEQARGAGKKVMVWTVNRPEDMRRLAGSGVDAIISDETELLLRTLRS